MMTGMKKLRASNCLYNYCKCLRNILGPKYVNIDTWPIANLKL